MATFRVDAIAGGGEGVARHDGLVVFVPRTAPGDVVQAEVVQRGRFARGSVRQVITPSPVRVEPPCTHYTRDGCGGCQLQHMSYAAQLSAKQRIVRDALERIAKREAPLPFIRESAEQWRYRSKLTLALRRRADGWVAGLHRFDDPGRVFALADCPITRREVVRVWRDVMDAAQHLPEARELRGSVRQTSGGFSFTVYGGRRWSNHSQLFDAVSSLTALWWEPEGGHLRRVNERRSLGGDEAARAGAAFAQVNPAVATELHEHVIERARAYSPAYVIDGYAGSGHTAAPLAESGSRVTAIELDPHAAAIIGRRLHAPSAVLVGRVEDHLAGALPADVVLLNPPRAGLATPVTAVLNTVGEKPRAVIYVSCNPATLARDIARMPGYGIQSVVSFDMFPQTAHVETVCELVPA